MTTETMTIVVSIVAIVLAVVAMWKARNSGIPITGAYLNSTLQDSTKSAAELTEVSLTAVRASEQLWRSGKIDRDERLDRAFAYIRQWFPHLDQAQILTALESAVLVVNAIVDNVPNRDMGMTTKP